MIEVYFGCYGKSQNVIIKNFSSKLKYTLNNIDSKLSNYQRKNVIGPQVATHILNKYELYLDIQKMEESEKKDEYCDVVLQEEGFLKKYCNNFIIF